MLCLYNELLPYTGLFTELFLLTGSLYVTHHPGMLAQDQTKTLADVEQSPEQFFTLLFP